MVTKHRDEIDPQGTHHAEPFLENKPLRGGRHSMDAAVARAAFFAEFEMHARLNQRGE